MSNGSLSKRVYDDILRRLLSGEFPPGHVFNRRQLAAMLDVSVAPVLEAMLALESEGLIETLPRKGTRVRKLGLADLQGQLVLREALECQAARLYCGAPIAKHQKSLLKLAGALDDVSGRSLKRLKQDVLFHHSLVGLAGVPALTEAHERIMKLGLLFSVEATHPDPAGASRMSHVRLVQALLTADADQAERLLRDHVRSGKEPLLLGYRERRDEETMLLEVPAWLGR